MVTGEAKFSADVSQILLHVVWCRGKVDKPKVYEDVSPNIFSNLKFDVLVFYFCGRLNEIHSSVFNTLSL